MTTSADNVTLVHGQGAVSTETNPAPCKVFQVDFNRAGLGETLPGHTDIDAYVAEAEQDSQQRAAIESGRKWIASTFYDREPGTLRTLRLKKGLSQARLAAIVGTTQPHIARIENGSTDIQISTLQRIAQALGIGMHDALDAFQQTRVSSGMA